VPRERGHIGSAPHSAAKRLPILGATPHQRLGIVCQAVLAGALALTLTVSQCEERMPGVAHVPMFLVVLAL
jgi:hypothetical protein